MMRTTLHAGLLGLALATTAMAANSVTFVFTADSYFGINRKEFQGDKAVDARYANRDMVQKINSLPNQTFPQDGELRSGEKIGAIDFVVHGGSIAHMMAAATITQSAADSWKEFDREFLQGIQLKNAQGEKAPLFYIPGVHDLTNAIGYYKRLDPKTDPSIPMQVYNRLVAPETPVSKKDFDVRKHVSLYSRTVQGIHLVFTQVWPDAQQREWIAQDIAKLPAGTPVLLFANVEPDAPSKLFINPNGKGDVNKDDKFENVIGEVFQGGTKVEDKSKPHEKALAEFVKAHPQIQGYFHGNTGLSDIKVWMGTEGDLFLPTYSVDSPVNGAISAKQEELVSFLVVTVDRDAQQTTARIVHWNADPKKKKGPLQWGNSASFGFRLPESVTPTSQPAPSENIPSEAVEATPVEAASETVQDPPPTPTP